MTVLESVLNSAQNFEFWFFIFVFFFYEGRFLNKNYNYFFLVQNKKWKSGFNVLSRLNRHFFQVKYGTSHQLVGEKFQELIADFS